MRVSVYLDEDAYKYLTRYGTLTEVTNRILALDQTIDQVGLPPAPSRDSCRRHSVDIQNAEYIARAIHYGFNNPYISLRRLLYYFYTNDWATALGWTAAAPPTATCEQRLLATALSNLRAYITLAPEHAAQVQAAITTLEELTDERE